MQQYHIISIVLLWVITIIHTSISNETKTHQTIANYNIVMVSLSRTSFSILFGALAVFCCSVRTIFAFSFSEIVSKQAERTKIQHNPFGRVIVTTPTTTTTALGLTDNAKNVVEDDAVYIYNKVKEFAYKDNEYDQHYHPLSDEVAEIEECKYMLREIVQVQSGCAAGTLAGKDLCENQDEAAEIVARLRRKIEFHEKRVAVRTKE